MKIILSRKGFDSSSGGFPSPIFPDNSMLSFPIPDSGSHFKYKDICTSKQSFPLTEALIALTNNKITPDDGVHLDPDINYEQISRANSWRAIFGQCGAAQGHLRNQNIGAGDLFLFFGWFRETTLEARGGLIYRPEAPDLHVLFGWLQISEIWIEKNHLQSWAKSHPHYGYMDSATDNAMYVATEKLEFNGEEIGVPGAGVFKKYHESLRLTAYESKKRTVWSLPSWFKGKSAYPTLTYHQDPNRWGKINDGRVTLETVGRGQEFVLNTDHYPEAVDWATEIIRKNVDA